jgi:pimeloyl-ACP methyl ester carboxylesterase
MISPTPRPSPMSAAFAAAGALLLGGLGFAAAADARTDPGCPTGARCGSVTVPLDRGRPSAGTLDIAYALLPHTDARRPAVGTIAPNPGGPGQSTIASAGLYAQALAPLRRRRDLLLVDPRGAGGSGALTCPSLAGQDPLALDQRAIATGCGADLGARAGLYGSAAVADDIDAVREALGIDVLDLWGDSYGTFLMPVYGARHPAHVRSIVLDGAFPIAFDPWGRDQSRAVRRVIGLVCARTRRCSGPRVIARMGRLARRLREHPVAFTVHGPQGPVRLTVGEPELADVAYGGGRPEVYGLLPAAVDAALDHDLAPLRRLVAASRFGNAARRSTDPTQFSLATAAATTCHDYPRPFDPGASTAQRRAQYRRALAALDPVPFRPFSPAAWQRTHIDAAPTCLDWPIDPTAGSPLAGRPLPDVPVLVQSGDLDTNTPLEQGRRAAAQFPHAILGVVANAGHTPDLQPCGVAMAVDFVEHLRTDPDRCRHAGRPPAVAGRPARLAAGLPAPAVRAAAPVRRALAVALATLADQRAAAGAFGELGAVDALRGGTYVRQGHQVRLRAARVVVDARADGLLELRGRAVQARLRLRGRGVPAARLALRTAGATTRVTGTVGRRGIGLRLAAQP